MTNIGNPDAHDAAQPPEPEAAVSEWQSLYPTSQLFGRYLAAVRASENIAVEVLAEAANRTQSWIRSVERGEILLTEPMVMDLDAALRDALLDAALRNNPEGTAALRAGTLPDGITIYYLTDVHRELSDEPHGQLATRLRDAFGPLQGRTDSSSAESRADGAIFPIGSGFSLADRVLVVFPVSLVVLISVTLLYAWAWVRRWQSMPDFDPQTIAAIGVTAIAAGAFLFAPAGWLLRCGGSLLRTPEARGLSRRCTDHLAEFELPTTESTHWYQPSARCFLQPEYQAPTVDQGLATDLAERQAFVFALLGLAQIYLADRAGLRWGWPSPSLNPGDHQRAALFMLGAVIAVMVALTSAWSARTFARRTHAALMDGLGIRDGDDTAEVEELEAAFADDAVV